VRFNNLFILFITVSLEWCWWDWTIGRLVEDFDWKDSCVIVRFFGSRWY